MEWLNLHTSVLDSPEFLGAEPLDRATWLCLLRYCMGQENGGTIAIEAKGWSDRKWQQVVRITLTESQRNCPLWNWSDRGLTVLHYPIAKQREVQEKRRAGKLGGQARTQAKTQASRSNGAKHQPKQNPSTNLTEGKGREEDRKTEEPVVLERTQETSTETGSRVWKRKRPIHLRKGHSPTWELIARDHGGDIANTALDAAKRFYGATFTHGQLEKVFRAAFRCDALALPVDAWPDPHDKPTKPPREIMAQDEYDPTVFPAGSSSKSNEETLEILRSMYCDHPTSEET